MATQEEIIQQYQEDRNGKLLQLENTLSSRIGQNAKQNAAVINDVSIISRPYVAGDVLADAKILSYQNGKDGNFASEIRKTFENLISNGRESIAYLTLTPQVFYQSDTQISIRVGESFFLLNSDGTSELLNAILGINESIDGIISFSELSKKLSAYSIPQSQLTVNKKFQSYLNAANEKLKSKNIFTPLSSFPVLVYSQVLIADGTVTGRFTTAFPKPEGYIDSSTPTPNIPSTPSTPNVPDTPGTPSTPSVPDTPAVPDEPQTPTTETNSPSEEPTTESQNGEKYLSIEAVKNDDPQIEEEEETSIIVSNVFIAEEDIGKSFRNGSLNAITTNEVINRTGAPPSPSGDTNIVVANNEKEEIERRVQTQKRLEESDAIEKEKPKEKSSTSPAGPNRDAPDGIASKNEAESKPVPDSKLPPKSDKANSTYKVFSSWIVENQPGPNDKFIINRRGMGEDTYNKDTPLENVNIRNKISKPEVYKSIFDHGTNLDKFFSGYKSKIKSPLDVALLCNVVTVGGFNKNVPYLFEEGCETQLLIVGAEKNATRFTEGMLGKARTLKGVPDANWSETPYWCGYTVDFLLYGNKEYVSDRGNLPIVNTSSVVKYFENSPVNPDGGSEANKKRKLTEIDSAITSKSSSISAIDVEIKNLIINKNKITNEIVEAEADNLVTKSITSKKKVERKKRDLSDVEKNISNKQKSKADLQSEINELKSLRQRVNSNTSKYDASGTVAKFELGIHFDAGGGLKEAGKELLQQIKDWEGGYIVRRVKYESKNNKGEIKISEAGHVELLLHFGSNGKIFVIYGNSGGSGLRNGTTMDFKKHNSIGDFAGKKALSGTCVYIVKRGTKSPYLKSLSGTVKKTDLYDEYVKLINANEKRVDPRAYNLLREIMEK